MLFCSDPQRETCFSEEDDVIFPRNHENGLFLLDQLLVPTLYHHRTTTLPKSSGTPSLSIFEFAGLSSEQQKQWSLQATCGDMKQNTKPQCQQPRTKVVLHPSSQNFVSCDQSCKTDETDSITSFSSSRSGGDQDASGVQKRSIFAPYWAKTGTSPRPVALEQNVVVHDHQDASTPRLPGYNRKATVVQLLQEASQKSSQMSSWPETSSSTILDRSCGQAKGHALRPPVAHQDHHEANNIVVTLSEPLPRPLIQQRRRAVSTSAISSILKKKGDGQQGGLEGERRRRSSSFSVSFDSKVNVVLVFQDNPPYQTRRTSPWWAPWLSGTGTGEVDVKKVIEQLAVVS